MHNRDKHPDIWPIFEAAKKELDQLKADRKVFTDQIGDLEPEIQALLKKKRDLNAQAMKDADRIRELATKVKNLSAAMGGQVLSNTG